MSSDYAFTPVWLESQPPVVVVVVRVRLLPLVDSPPFLRARFYVILPLPLVPPILRPLVVVRIVSPPFCLHRLMIASAFLSSSVASLRLNPRSSNTFSSRFVDLYGAIL